MDISSITERWDDLLLIIGAIGVACEGTIAALLVLVRALRALAGWLGGVALLSHTLTDDHIIGRLVATLDGAARGLESAAGIIPRLRGGSGKRPGLGGGAALAALLVGVAALGGCGMSAMDATRASIATTARMTTAADPIIAAAYDGVADGLDEGTLTPEDAEARMRRLDRAERALTSLRHALIAVDLSLDAAEAGAECGLQAALDGAVGAVQELLRALDAAGLDVPELLHVGAALAAGYVDPVECTADEATTAALLELRAVAL